MRGREQRQARGGGARIDDIIRSVSGERDPLLCKDIGDPMALLTEEQFLRLHRFTADDFHRMTEDRILGDFLHELIDGMPTGEHGGIRRWWPDEVERMAELGILDLGAVEHRSDGFVLDR